MAAGLPIVTPPFRTVGHEVVSGVNALTYDEGDTHGLAHALTRLVEDEGERRRLARNSPLVLAALPGWEATVHAHASLYREAWLAGPRGDPRPGLAPVV